MQQDLNATAIDQLREDAAKLGETIDTLERIVANQQSLINDLLDRTAELREDLDQQVEQLGYDLRSEATSRQHIESQLRRAQDDLHNAEDDIHRLRSDRR